MSAVLLTGAVYYSLPSGPIKSIGFWFLQLDLILWISPHTSDKFLWASTQKTFSGLQLKHSSWLWLSSCYRDVCSPNTDCNHSTLLYYIILQKSVSIKTPDFVLKVHDRTLSILRCQIALAPEHATRLMGKAHGKTCDRDPGLENTQLHLFSCEPQWRLWKILFGCLAQACVTGSFTEEATSGEALGDQWLSCVSDAEAPCLH